MRSGPAHEVMGNEPYRIDQGMTMEFTRRNFIKLAGVGAAAISFGGLTTFLTGCSSSPKVVDGASVTGNANEVVVSMTTGSEPAAGFDPMFSWGCGEHVHEPLIQSTLITTDQDLNFVNDLATSYSCSEDGMTWTFTIREDAYFTNGEQLTARDVAFTINGINNAEAAEADLSMVAEAVAVDDFTVEFRMNKPFNALLYTLAVVGIVPANAYDSATYGANPIGSGRYMLEQWDQGQQVILKANPDYYGTAPKMERVIVVFMEEDASLAAANSKEVDIAYTAATMAKSTPSDYDLFVCKSVDSRGISFPSVPAEGTKKDGENDYPLGNNVTQDVALRRAMNYAVNRDTMIENVLSGYGTPAYSVADGTPWASEDMIVKTDADMARKILEEGGWVAGDDGVLVKDGIRAQFDLYYSSSDSVRQALASEFANQMAGFGIKIDIHGAGWDDLYPHEFSDSVLWGWGANSPTQMYDLLYSSGVGNYASYENATVDAHMDAALAKSNVEDSYTEWKLAQWDGTTGVAPQGAATWVWFANVDHLYFKRGSLQVAEQKPHPHGHGWSLVNNVDQWSWSA